MYHLLGQVSESGRITIHYFTKYVTFKEATEVIHESHWEKHPLETSAYGFTVSDFNSDGVSQKIPFGVKRVTRYSLQDYQLIVALEEEDRYILGDPSSNGTFRRDLMTWPFYQTWFGYYGQNRCWITNEDPIKKEENLTAVVSFSNEFKRMSTHGSTREEAARIVVSKLNGFSSDHYTVEGLLDSIRFYPIRTHT